MDISFPLRLGGFISPLHLGRLRRPSLAGGCCLRELQRFQNGIRPWHLRLSQQAFLNRRPMPADNLASVDMGARDETRPDPGVERVHANHQALGRSLARDEDGNLRNTHVLPPCSLSGGSTLAALCIFGKPGIQSRLRLSGLFQPG